MGLNHVGRVILATEAQARISVAALFWQKFSMCYSSQHKDAMMGVSLIIKFDCHANIGTQTKVETI